MPVNYLKSSIGGLPYVSSLPYSIPLACAMMALSVSNLSAQDAGAGINLQTIVVQDNDRSTEPVKGYVAKVSSSGTKTDTPIVLTPQSV